MRYVKADIWVNILLAVSSITAIGVKVAADHSLIYLKYFTTDSNLLMAFASIVWLCFALREKPLPKWALVLKFSGTAAVVMTLLTVIFFLAPMRAHEQGIAAYFDFFKGNELVLHLTTPLLAIFSWIFCEKGIALSIPELFWGVLPTLLYAFVYMLMVVKLTRWKDFYGFTFGGNQAFVLPSFLAVQFVSFGICCGLNYLSSR